LTAEWPDRFDNLIYDNSNNLETGRVERRDRQQLVLFAKPNNIEWMAAHRTLRFSTTSFGRRRYDIYVDSSSRTGFFSDYNDLYATGSGQIVYYLISFNDILDWQDDVPSTTCTPSAHRRQSDLGSAAICEPRIWGLHVFATWRQPGQQPDSRNR